MTRGKRGEEKPIDFSWMIYIGMNKLGFSYREVGRLYFGLWVELFEEYKKSFNFEKKFLYVVNEMEEVSSLDDL